MPKRLSSNQLFLRAMSESQLQDSIIQLAEIVGWTVVHINDSRMQRATGLPDLLLIRRPRVVWAELKRERNAGSHKNDPTPIQQWWLDELQACGQEAYLWRPSDWHDETIAGILNRST
jgi:hypothetical protein